MESGTVENEQPFLIANSISSGGNLLSALKTQLKKCLSFDFCVAFAADGGLQTLVESFEELRARGARGRLLTSTYLNFNSPDASASFLNTTTSKPASTREISTPKATCSIKGRPPPSLWAVRT